MSDTLPDNTAVKQQDDAVAKKQQSLLHVGSQNRDALEAIGATYDPPMRWQNLARQVLKNFIAGSQHDAALKRAQLRLSVDAATGVVEGSPGAFVFDAK